MLRSLRDLDDYKVSASDGDIGSVVEFLIDDERWIVWTCLRATPRSFPATFI